MAGDVLLQENTVFLKYALNGKLAEKYLPEPRVRTNKHGNKTRFWWQSDVEKAMENEALQRQANKIKEKRHKNTLTRRAKRRAERKKLSYCQFGNRRRTPCPLPSAAKPSHSQHHASLSR